MKELRFYISSLIFIVLTAIKLLSPALAAQISDTITDVLVTEGEQTAAVIELGSSLTGEDIVQVFFGAENKADEAMHTEAIKPSPTPEPTPIMTPPPTPTPTPEPTVPPKVAAFMEEQATFSAYETPSDVSLEVPELPFEYTCPVEGYTSSGFGYRMHPIQNEIKYHYGTDFAANKGESVHAFADGTIVAEGENDGYGNYVLIFHEDGYSTLYAHCSKLCMNCGAVKKGDVIALVGDTGLATGPHLHFELKKDDTYYNPEFYL